MVPSVDASSHTINSLGRQGLGKNTVELFSQVDFAIAGTHGN